MRLAALLVLASALPISAASADDAAALTEALNKAATGAVLAEAYMAVCGQHDPQSAQARRDAMAGWSYRVDLPGYYRFLAAAAEPLPDLANSLDEHAETARQAVEAEITAGRAPCAGFPDELTGEKFDIERAIRDLLRNAGDFGIAVADAPVLPKTEDIEVVPLVMLSAQLAAKMDEVGSKSGAAQNRDLRAAREHHARAWLEQRMALVIYGRVTGDNELREWRDDRQSAFVATCHSFADEEHEARMADGLGENRIVAARMRWISDERQGGTLALNDCRVFTHDPAQAELAQIADDSAGLMLRPLEYDEAFAGPGAGIATGDIDRVLYDAEFQNRIDGFGNGYIQRREDIYVLLRDGTAYRHEWNFAFTDLDVALSHEREPERWFAWRESWGSLTLTQTGGLDAGTEIDLSDARRLMPAPQGQRLGSTYYYLNVGMGGGRSDRDYAFALDGQVVHRRGGFVAGNFGTSYIIATGGDEVTASNYTFDGYTLLIDGPEGQERHFTALVEGQDANRPEEIIIDGQVHWLREDDGQ